MTGGNPSAAPSIEVRLPDLGTTGEVTVLELLVKVGDQVEKEQALLTLESEKATMDVPATAAGKVSRILVQAGDKVSTGTAVLELEGPGQIVAAEGGGAPVAAAPAQPTPRQSEPYGGEPYLDTVPIQPLKAIAPAENDAAAQDSVPVVAPSPLPASFDYDVLVIGAGPGGYTAAFRAADLGL